MSQRTRREYLVRMRVRYQRRSDPALRRAILDEFCEVSGYERKYALKLLNGTRPGPARSPATRGRRGAVYGEAEQRVLEDLWEMTDRPCGKRLQVIMGEFLPHYEKHRGAVPEAVRGRLLKISAAVIDRLLRARREAEREKSGASRRRPRAGSEVRAQVPLRDGPATGSQAGWMQADTVWHCGNHTGGTFVCSLLLTCTWSHWTVVRATWNHSDLAIHSRMREIEQSLPFALLGCHTDNGGEFINQTLIRYFKTRKVPVVHTRSRPYIKNDNAHAEERNRRRVRDFLGYERFGEPFLTSLADELMEKWSLWNNLFMPTGKLESKKREGSRVIRKHEKPSTPCDRLLGSAALGEDAKAALRRLREETDPIALRQEIEEQKQAFFALLAAGRGVPAEAGGHSSGDAAQPAA